VINYLLRWDASHFAHHAPGIPGVRKLKDLAVLDWTEPMGSAFDNR
jgi:hypothetical protein